MKAHTACLPIRTEERKTLVSITQTVEDEVRNSGIAEGLLVNSMRIAASVFINDEEPGLKRMLVKSIGA